MFERILVPTDGSEGAEAVIERAVDIAETYGATIEALFVADSRIQGVVPEEAEDAVRTALQSEGEDAIKDIATVARERDVPINAVVREGIPHQAILEHAAENDVDLIVMGTHGRSGVERQLIGSVAERVVRMASIPVMTVPLSGTGERDERQIERGYQ